MPGIGLIEDLIADNSARDKSGDCELFQFSLKRTGADSGATSDLAQIEGLIDVPVEECQDGASGLAE